MMNTVGNAWDWIVSMDAAGIVVLLLIIGVGLFVLISHLPWRRRSVEQP